MACGIRAVAAPFDLPRVNELRVDWIAFAFALGASLLSAALFGLWPAWRSTRIDPQEALQSSGRTTTEGRPGHQMGWTLVAVEVALSAVVLLGAGLLIHSFIRVLQVDPGVQVRHLITANLQLPPEDYGNVEKVNEFYRRVLERVEKLPGVQSAGVTSELPLTAIEANGPTAAADRPLPPLAQWVIAGAVWTSPGYFHAAGIPLIAGRIFRPEDDEHRVIVVSQNLANRLWPHQSAIDRPLRIYSGNLNEAPYRVIGVVGVVHAASLAQQPENIVYSPYWQNSRTSMAVVVRTVGDPRSVAGAIRRVVAQMDSRVPVSNIRTMQDLVDDTVAQRRFQMFILLAFAGMGLVLACLGIYGVLSFNVGKRTGEIGIRMALGAPPPQIRRMVLWQGMLPVVTGLLSGIAVSIAAGRVVQSLLFGIQALDPMTYMVGSVVLLSVAVFASVVPARRAAALNPLDALRSE